MLDTFIRTERSLSKMYFALLVPFIGYIIWLFESVFARPSPKWAFLLLLWALSMAILARLLTRDGTLRVCDRLDRHAGRVAFGIIGVAALAFIGVSVIQGHYFAMGAHAEDTAYYNQVLWNTLHGNFLSGNVQQERLYDPPVSNDIALHVSPILLVGILPIYALFPHFLTLLILRDVALAAAAWPLFLLTRERMGGTAGIAAVILYLTNPTVIAQSSEAFYLLQLVPLPFFWAFRSFVRDEIGGFLGWLTIAISMREDVAITMAGFGLWALVSRRRFRWVSFGLLLPVSWWVVANLLIQPAFGRTADVTLAGVNQTPSGILQMFLGNPSWLWDGLRDGGLDYLYKLLRPVAFMGVLGTEGLIIAPGLVATLFLGQVVAYGSDPFSRFALLLSCALIGTAVVFVSRFGRKYHWDLRVFAVLMLFLLPSVSILDGMKDAVQVRLASHTVRNDAIVLWEAIGQIPHTASVAAPNYALPALSNRSKLFYIQYQHMYPQVQVDYILLDHNLDRITTNPELRKKYVVLFERLSHSKDYETVWQQGEYSLLRWRKEKNMISIQSAPGF